MSGRDECRHVEDGSHCRSSTVDEPPSTQRSGIPAERRDVSSLTLGVVKSRLPQLKKMVQNFRQEVLKVVSEDENPEEVIQMNIQLFPLTREEK